jgi:hypothetical protein
MRMLPSVTVKKALSVIAVHAHAAAVVTTTNPLPPAASYDADVGAMLNVHVGAVPNS